FCRPARARRSIPIIEPAEAIGREAAIRQRFTHGARTSHEATRTIFHPLWRDLSFSCRCSCRVSLTKSHSTKHGIHCRGGNSAGDYLSCSLPRRRVRQGFVLDNPLCARVRNPCFDVRCAPDPYSQRQGRNWTKLATLDAGWSRVAHLFLEQVNRKEHRFPPWIAHILNIGSLPGLLFSITLLYSTSPCRRSIRRRSNQQHIKHIAPSDHCGSVFARPFTCIVHSFSCL